MDSTTQKQILVILGSGRSGTSILTKILAQLGMTISSELVPLSEQNSEGFWEDRNIVEIHLNILKTLKSHAYLPLSENFLREQGLNQYIIQLNGVVQENIKSAKTIWGFKDPRTPALLPLWLRVFNSGKIVPKYILTLRDPRSVVASMHKQYNDSTEIAELSWLLRNCEALYQTGANCFIVHYEDWFTDDAPQICEKLLRYTGLDKFWDEEKSVSKAVSEIVKPNLNRAVFNDYEVKNRYVLKLQAQLEQCHGDQFDRQALMEVVMECRKAMDEFSGWAIEAQRFFKQRVNNKNNSYSKFNDDPSRFVNEANKTLQKCKDLSDENKNLRIKTSVQTKELEDIKELRKNNEQLSKEIISLQTSTSFQLGQILVNGIVKPGKNTILIPLYLLRTILASKAVKL